jgi:hypothetical protein
MPQPLIVSSLRATPQQKFSKPGKGSDQALAVAFSLSARLSVHKYPEEVVDVEDIQEVIDIYDNEDIDGIAGDFLPSKDDRANSSSATRQQEAPLWLSWEEPTSH